MSQSQHPVALRIEQQVGDATRLLATVMCLPLLDGIFPALVLAGALSSPTGILEVGLLIFGGSATVAVILAEMDGSPREQATQVLLVGVVVVIGATVEAALAPTIAGFIDISIFERFAGVVILAVAARTASARVGEILPRPAVIIALGLVASADLAGAELVFSLDPELMARAAAAAGVAVLFALHLAVFGPQLRRIVDIDRFRFGSAVALGVLPLGLFGLVPGDAPLALAVLGLSFLFAFDPDGSLDVSLGRDGEDPADALESDVRANGGRSVDGPRADDQEYPPDGPASQETVADEERAPWL